MKTAAGNSDTLRGSPQGMTLGEIAEELGITRGGVWMILQSAYEKLRRSPKAIAILEAQAQMAREIRARQPVEE